MIVAGASAYPREIDFERIGEIAKKVGAIYFVDMAHIAGLVAAGLHVSPVPFADVVTTTTHKTLRGPRGGMILCKEPARRTYPCKGAARRGAQQGNFPRQSGRTAHAYNRRKGSLLRRSTHR